MSLYRDDKPIVRSISWSPVGVASNSGCLIAVCTSEGHVKVYRPPFCDFCAEWVEVVDLTKRLYEHFQCTEFRGAGTPPFDFYERNASDQVDSMSKEKSLVEMPENQMLPLISAEQYASRSAMLCSLVVSWSPLLRVASEFHPAHNTCASISLLALGGRSGKISLWGFYPPDCYTIEYGKIPTAVKFVGLLQAHNSLVTTISWLLLAFDSSNPQILLATGSSDGSVKVWLGDNDKLLKSSDVDQTPFILLKEDNLVRSWILRERCLDEVAIHSDMPRNNSSTCPSRDAFDSCFGAAMSPGNLVIATVHCFDVEKLNRMYEARILRAAIEYYWIGGLQVDFQLKCPFPIYTEENSSFSEKDLTNWGCNIIWSLNQYQCLDKPLVLWDTIAALLALKDNMSKYVEHLLIKWLSSSYLGSHMDLTTEKVLSHICSSLSNIPSRLLHLLNIICRRVMLAELDADQITRIKSKVQNLEGECPATEKQITKWIEILLSSERELRERLVGFSFSAFQTSMSHPEATPQTGHWYPIGLAQMEQWIALNSDHVHDQLKFMASEVTNEKRFPPSSVEPCPYCSASVPFESPEVGFCQGENSSSGNDKCHRLLRCSVSMQVCPSRPLWFCICCHRVAFILAPEPVFRMSSFNVDSDTLTRSLAVPSKPLCPFCGILLQRRQPDFLLSPTPV